MDPARWAAFELQRVVAEQDAYANLVWPGILARNRLAGRDAAFATELGYGALRWQGRHDAVLAACVDRGLESLDPAVLDVLRLGVHQLHEMRVGDHAAVGQSVDLARRAAGSGAAGLVNAVLRRVARGGGASDWIAELVAAGAVPDAAADPAGHLAVAASHPRWIVAALHDALASSVPGRTWEDTRALALADNAPAGITLVARTMSRDALLDRVAQQGIRAQPGAWSPRAVRVSAVSPAGIPEVATGAAGVQDEGSQLVALALAGAALDGRDERWLDMCAGPGGKAALLADEVAGRGGVLTAVEPHAHRADLVRAALRPVRGRHEVVVADALDAPLQSGFDRVLVDAPCTGLGALRRRPESRWRRSAGDLAALTALQRRLLARAIELTRPGGVVLYATCSPHLAETDAVLGAVRNGHVEALTATGGIPDSALTVEGHLRTWPHLHDTDGMFAALIRRS